MNSNATAVWRAHRRGAYFANPCFTQIHPTCIPRTGDHQSKLTLMSESLRNDGRIWVPRTKGDDPAAEPRSPRTSATTTWSASTRPSATWCPRDIASRAAKNVCDEGRGVGPRRTGRLPRLRRRDRAHGPRGRRGEVRQPLRHVRADHRRGSRTRCRCGSTPPCTTRWADCGWTTTSRPPSPACSRSARPTSPTTARTGSAPPPSCRAWPTATSCCRRPSTTTSPATRTTSTSPPNIPSYRRCWRIPRTGCICCWPWTATAPPTHSTASSANSCGSSAAWPAPTADCARRWSGFRRSARSSGGASRSRASGRSSTSRWRRPTGSSTTWSSPS